MKKIIFIWTISVAILFLGCDQTTNNEPTTNSLHGDTVQSSNKAGESYSQMKTDTLLSDVDKIKLVITYYPYPPEDYVAEHESGVSDTSKYAIDRDVNKGQIHFPCDNKRQHDYRISIQKIINIISIKYDMTVYDKTDYVFTKDTIFEIHTSTANAGIFTDSNIKFIPNNIDFSSKTKYPRQNNEDCNFNDYLFNLVLNFCQKNNIKTK